jgi:hypothetical protein
MSASFATKIGEATGIIGSLADIIAQYEGRYLLKKAFIKNVFDNKMDRWYLTETRDNALRFGNHGLSISLDPCESFPVCDKGVIDCLACQFYIVFFAENKQDEAYFTEKFGGPGVKSGNMSFDVLRSGMLRGGVLSVGDTEVDKTIIDRIESQMSRAYPKEARDVVELKQENAVLRKKVTALDERVAKFESICDGLVKQSSWSTGLTGDLDRVNISFNKNVMDMNYGLSGACQGGNHEVIKFMIAHGATQCIFCKKSISMHH